MKNYVFVTNFTNFREIHIVKSCELAELTYKIEDMTYDINGNILYNYKALWILEEDYNSQKFEKYLFITEEIRKQYKKYLLG